MKKIVTLCLITVFLLSVNAQKSTVPNEITKNKIEAGGFFGYQFNTADVPVAKTDFTLPSISYRLETSQASKNKFYLNADAAYRFYKTTVDGEAEGNLDNFANLLSVNIDPSFRMYLSKEMFQQKTKPVLKEKNKEDEWEEGTAGSSNKWFVSFGLPVNFSNTTPQNDQYDSFSSMSVDLTTNIGYDDKKVDIKRLSPWAQFQEGLFAYGLFEYRLTESYDGEDVDEMPLYVGVAGDFAYNSQKYLSNSMIRGFASVKYQLNDKVIRVLPPAPEVFGPYIGTIIDLKYGVEIAKDFTDKINANLSLSYLSIQLLDDPQDDSQNFLEMFGRVNFYPIPDLALWGGIDWTGHLPEELDYIPEFNFKFGAVYTLDFLKMKK